MPYLLSLLAAAVVVPATLAGLLALFGAWGLLVATGLALAWLLR